MKSGKGSFSLFKRSFSSANRGTRLLRHEELECRALLSITTGEYEQIRTDLADFELPAQMEDINIIELTDLTAAGLQSAINTAAQTEKSDLLLFRSSEGNNTISLAGETIYVNIDADNYGQLILYGGADSSLNISVGGKDAPAFAFAMGDVKLANFNLVDIDLSVSLGAFATSSLVGNHFEVKNVNLCDINGNSVNPDEITLNKDAENKQKIEASANGSYSSGTKWEDCDMSNNYAVIFAGGANAEDNHYRYYSAVLDLYTVLSTE
ncbi:MAG: hypothetical protein Q4G69_07860, partial [Planctomycetia bacterium]|nr:hypothetical protein [Planctomycetia bacterium]